VMAWVRKYSAPNVVGARIIDLLHDKSTFVQKLSLCVVEPLFGWGGGLGATYTVNLRFIGKLIGDFLLVTIELFHQVLLFCHNSRV